MQIAETPSGDGMSWQPLEMLLKHAPMSIAIFDRNMIYLAVNDQWMRDHGQGHDSLIGLNHYDVLTDIPESWKQAHQCGLSGKSYKNDDDLWIQPDGSKHWRRWAVEPWYDAAGEVGGIVILVENITKRKRYEEELKERGFILENIGQGVYCTNESGYILYTNQALDSMFSYSRGELLGRHEAALYRASPSTAGLTDDWTDSTRLTQAQRRENVRGIKKNGDKFDVAVTNKRLFTQGKNLMVSICEDITEQRKLERQLKDRRNVQERLLQQQTAALTATAIAHELNQPLLAISAYTAAALQMLNSGDSTSETFRHTLEACVLQSQRAASTTRHLLETINKDSIPMEFVRIDQEVMRVISFVKSDHDTKFATHVEAEPGLPAVYVHRIHIEKVLHNLIRNSIEAMEGAGTRDPTIIVSVRHVTSDKMIHLMVQDNGPGFALGQKEHVFTPFYTTKKQGIGMGLKISRSMIEAYGGRLWTDGEAGEGARLNFTLPVIL